MPYAIPECHINLRICIADGTQYAVNHIMALVGQEYRAGLRIERIDLADPIILRTMLNRFYGEFIALLWL